MKIKEVAPNIFCLTVKVPVSVREVNIFIFTGKVPTLLDAGTNSPEVFEGIQQGLKAIGISEIKQILLTHWHVDHAGAARVLAAKGTKVLIHPLDYQEWIDFMNGKALEDLTMVYREWGVPDEKIPQLLAIYKYLFTVTDKPPEVEFIEHNQEVVAGDYRLRAILTPGHTSGHLTFFEENTGMLFSGDQLLPDQVSYPGVWREGNSFVSGLPAYLDSLTTLEKLQAKLNFPAHGEAQENPSGRCREVREIINQQVQRYKETGSIFESASRLVSGKPNAEDILFAFLHYVYGWHTLKHNATGTNREFKESHCL